MGSPGPPGSSSKNGADSVAADSNVARVHPMVVRTVRGTLENGTSDSDASMPTRRVWSRFVKNPRVWRIEVRDVEEVVVDLRPVYRDFGLASDSGHAKSQPATCLRMTGFNGGSGPSSNGRLAGVIRVCAHHFQNHGSSKPSTITREGIQGPVDGLAYAHTARELLELVPPARRWIEKVPYREFDIVEAKGAVERDGWVNLPPDLTESADIVLVGLEMLGCCCDD